MNNQKRFLLLAFLCSLAWFPAHAQQPNSGIAGKIQFDFDNDCIGDVDTITYGTLVAAWKNGQLIASGQVGNEGKYFIAVAAGDYLVVPQKYNGAINYCPADTLPATVAAGDTTENVDFVQSFNPVPVTSISGYIFQDVDGDCRHDGFEQGLAGWQVTIVLYAGGLVQTYLDTTDANGYYELLNPPGVSTANNGYVITSDPQGNGLNCVFPCGQEVLVTFQNGTSFQGDISVHCDSLPPCPQMEVSIATNVLRPCQPSTYHLHYCNNGAATAVGASVQVTIDPLLAVTGSSIPWTAIGGNTYSFDLGDLSPEQCGDFTINVLVPCSDPVGTTYCSEAHAFPDTSCAPANANWDGSQIEVTATCIGDSVVFTIHNVGLGSMQNALNYIVIEDNILVMQAPGQFQLAGGESTTVAFPANGSYLRMVAQQSPGFAGLSTPVAWAEGCNGGGNMSLGFVNQYALGDEDPWLDVFCLESVNSYDPNDKNGFPRGVDAAHYIDQNVELEYLVRFQNTGTAPALNIEIRDILPAELDPTTVRPGASSHAYTWDMQDNGVVVFKFADVNLPDSATSQLLSQGFVQFRVQQHKDVALGTKIKNTAAIYFDNNAPVITNQTLHTVGKDFVLTSTPTLLLPNVRVLIAPNPVTNQAQVWISGLDNTNDMRFTLYSAMGKSLLTDQFSGNNYEFEARPLPAGIYFYEVRRDGKTVGKGKLVKM